MNCLYLFGLLVSAALCNAAASTNNVLRARAIDSKTICQDDKLQRNCVDVTLRCMTGKDEDGFEVQISPRRQGGRILRPLLVQPQSHLQGHQGFQAASHFHGGRDIIATGQANGADYTFVGKLVNLVGGFTDDTCTGRHPDGDCSYMHSAMTVFDLETAVPLSVTKLAWLAHVHVHLQCLITPLNPEDEDTLPNIPSIHLSECEDFHHILTFSPVPPPKDCLIKISLVSNLGRQGFGYTLEKCTLSLPGQSIPLIRNGRTQKSSGVEVTGRNADGGSGLEYQLYLEGVSPAQAASGSVQCEAVRCRSSIVATGDYSQCTQGTLPMDFVLASGRAPAPLLDAPALTVTPMRGDVKIYIPREGTSRSSPANFMECVARSGSV